MFTQDLYRIASRLTTLTFSFKNFPKGKELLLPLDPFPRVMDQKNVHLMPLPPPGREQLPTPGKQSNLTPNVI